MNLTKIYHLRVQFKINFSNTPEGDNDESARWGRADGMRRPPYKELSNRQLSIEHYPWSRPCRAFPTQDNSL